MFCITGETYRRFTLGKVLIMPAEPDSYGRRVWHTVPEKSRGGWLWQR